MKAQITFQKTAVFFCAAVLLLMTGIASPGNGKLFAQGSKYKFQETINLVDLVKDAASEISRNGESPWNRPVRMAIDNGQGWVDYLWPKPGTTKALRKSSFVKRIVVRGEVLVAGTGVYLD